MVLRDKVTVLERKAIKDEYGGSEVSFIPIQTVYCNVRIFFSQNEDGLQNRQGLAHLEGTLITRDKFMANYFEYDNHIYHILTRNPQAKQQAYKFREVKQNGRS